MSHHNLDNAQHMVARRTFLRLMAGTTVMAALAACQPITRPAEEPVAGNAQETGGMELQKVIANGVELHYIEQGQGDPVVLLHGGQADYRNWLDQMDRLSQANRVIAYSQRYAYPNQNLPIVADYTTLVDAEDLAAFVQALNLGPTHVVGYSSGAFMALAMALDHPELTRTLLLAEPPILQWLPDLRGGDVIYSDFMREFWQPVGDAFRQGDKELALRLSMQYFIGADVLDELPPEVRQSLDDNLASWEAFTTSHDAFPMIDKDRVEQLQMPTMLLTAAQTTPLQRVIVDELERLIPATTRVTIPKATHEMWTEQPDACGEAVLQFLLAHA